MRRLFQKPKTFGFGISLFVAFCVAPAFGQSPAPQQQLPAGELTRDQIKVLGSQPISVARKPLRRAARTSTEPNRRALALAVLARNDATSSTARICVRALRTDDSPLVRRSASECIGRHPARVGSLYTTDLVAALNDDDLDVVAMAAWALSSVGDASGVEALTKLTEHPDKRLGQLAYRYTLRLRRRVGMTLVVPEPETNRDLERIPAGHHLIDMSAGFEPAVSALWLGVYGGASGWLHGALLPSAHGGEGGRTNFILISFGSTFAGAAVMGAYGFTRANTYEKANTVVQLGTFGTLAGYGAGVVSAAGTKRGLNLSTYGAVGALAGTVAGVALAETTPPSLSSMGIGAAIGLGSGISMSGIFMGFGAGYLDAFALGALSAGISGGLSTLVLGPYDYSVTPTITATMGGLTGAVLFGGTLAIFENASLDSQPETFTQASGWAIAGGYALGAGVGYGVGLLIPARYDLFGGAVKIKPPVISAVSSLKDQSNIPVATIGGTF